VDKKESRSIEKENTSLIEKENTSLIKTPCPHQLSVQLSASLPLHLSSLLDLAISTLLETPPVSQHMPPPVLFTIPSTVDSIRSNVGQMVARPTSNLYLREESPMPPRKIPSALQPHVQLRPYMIKVEMAITSLPLLLVVHNKALGLEDSTTLPPRPVHR
jgi:hypothetical protein